MNKAVHLLFNDIFFFYFVEALSILNQVCSKFVSLLSFLKYFYIINISLFNNIHLIRFLNSLPIVIKDFLTLNFINLTFILKMNYF